jgi:hypothetical protein
VLDFGVTRCGGLLPLFPLHWWAVCPLDAEARRALALGFAGRLRGVPSSGALSFLLLVSRSCTAGTGLRLVSVRVVLGAWLALVFCCVWLLLFSVSVVL